jgi:uncharacterized lipoprotein YmbA
MKSKVLLKLMLSLLLTTVLSGCISSKYIEPKKYMFDLQTEPVKKHHKKYVCSVLLESVTYVEPFNQLDFLYRINSDRYLEDYYHTFLVAPAIQLDTQFRDYLKANGHFNLNITRVAGAKNRVKMKLVELYADYRDRNNPQAVVTLNFVLTKLVNGKAVVIMDKELRSAISLNQKTSECLLAGWNVGINDIFYKVTKILNNKFGC